MSDMIIYRNAVEVATVSIDEKTILLKKIMNDDKITSEFFTTTILPLQLGDNIVFNGNNYFLNLLPTIEKKDTNTFKYVAIFQSVLYNLYNKLLISADGLSDFSYTGDATLFLQLIVNSINEIDAGWTVGTVDSSNDLTIFFINENCRSALTKISEQFLFEFAIDGKVIHFQKAVGTNTNHVFEYGRNNGLYALDRKQIDGKHVFTKVYGFGGTKNIPYTYRDHAKRLVFEERYLAKNTAIYGVRETNFTDDTIYPQRTATLTAINILFVSEGFNVNDSWIEDTSLDFNINDFLISGITAKIVFKSGDLTGYEFEIWKYEHSTKRIYINPFTDTDAYVLPNASNQPKIGDKYTLVNIAMPQSYIFTAEADLKAATQIFLDDYSVPKALYIVKIDVQYAKAQNITLDAGDLVKVKDQQLGIDKFIRISQISFPIVNPFKITAIIADFVPYTLLQSSSRISSSISKDIKQIFNQINNINNISNTNTVINNNNADDELNAIWINARKFFYTKGFDNVLNPQLFEAGDILSGNNWDRYTVVKKWLYLGGIKELDTNYDKIETIDLTPDP